MRLSVRFVILRVLAAIAYAVTSLADKLTLRGFVRNLDIRAELITNSVHDTLQEHLLREFNVYSWAGRMLLYAAVMRLRNRLRAKLRSAVTPLSRGGA